MVIKIIKKSKKGKHIEYKSPKRILTPKDIKEADKFDLFLSREIKKIEQTLLSEGIISRGGIKKDPLRVWYIIGKSINNFLKDNQVVQEDENLFWNYLYGRSSLINKTIPFTAVHQNRNDFKTASLLAKYPFKILKEVGPWALWREILVCRIFLDDKRILNFIISELTKFPRTRDKARPFLKTTFLRLKRVDTSVLDDKELLEILKKG